jgi:signal transduction histidine kinase
MGTHNGDIYQTRADGTLSPQLLGKKMIAVRGLYLDSSNQLWTGTWGQGLHAPAGRLAEQTNPPLFINDIMADRSGQIWIATWNNGVLKVNGNELQQVSKGNMNGNRVSDLEEAADGSIWAATNDGLCQLTRNGRQFLYNTRNGLFPNDEVTALLFDAATGLWVATAGGGVVRCRFGNLETYTTSNGMSNNNVTSLVRDINGRIWAGTEDGLSVIDPQHGTISTYRPSESLKGNSVTNNCALLTKDGKLLFGTADGLLVIDPTQFRKTAVLQPTITALTVNGTALLKERPATLRHDQNQLTFYFSVFEYNKQQLPMFQYYLQGLEADWQHITPQNSVSYSELPPGDYVFHVRSFGTHGQYQQETTYAFTISQPWYNRWWAWMLYLLVVTLTLLYVWRNARERFRLHQQMNMERQLNNFRVELFTNITHEFRTPLAIIKSAVDKLSQDGRNAAAQQTARRATSRLLRMVNQLMEYRKINTDNLRLQVETTDIIVFVGQIVQDLREMAAQKEQRLKFIPFDKHYEMLVDRQMVETIIYNLLSNAVKYTPEQGAITVRVKKASPNPSAKKASPSPSEGGEIVPRIQIVVEDTGPGISPQQQARLFKPFMQGYVSQGGMGIGLYTAHRMATLHHGTLEYSQGSIHNAQCSMHNAQSAAAKDGAGNNCALCIEHCELKIGIAPFAAHEGKVYPPHLMQQVIEQLIQQHPQAHIFLFGRGEQEDKYFAEWCRQYPQCVNVSKLANSLRQELILISHLNVMISMDSSNMHLASLTGTPVVSVWGATHPYAGFMGWGQKEENAVQLDMDCRPCSIYGQKPCKRGDYACMNNIKPETIVEKTNNILLTQNKH